MNKATDQLLSAIDENKNRVRKQHRTQNVIPIITPSDNCQVNVDKYVKEANKLHEPLFNHSVRWESNCWDIKGFESTVTTRSVTHASNILFTQDNGLDKKNKIP